MSVKGCGGMAKAGTEGRQAVEVGTGSAVSLAEVSSVTLAATLLGISDTLGFLFLGSYLCVKLLQTTFLFPVNSKGKGNPNLLWLP